MKKLQPLDQRGVGQIILVVILLVALFGSIVLVTVNQDNRSRAGTSNSFGAGLAGYVGWQDPNSQYNQDNRPAYNWSDGTTAHVNPDGTISYNNGANFNPETGRWTFADGSGATTDSSGRITYDNGATYDPNTHIWTFADGSHGTQMADGTIVYGRVFDPNTGQWIDDPRPPAGGDTGPSGGGASVNDGRLTPGDTGGAY